MVFGYRYIDIDEKGCVIGAKAVPTEDSIDTEGVEMPTKPTNAVYALHYSSTDGLYWVKVADFEPESPLSETEQAIFRINANVDYLAMMTE